MSNVRPPTEKRKRCRKCGKRKRVKYFGIDKKTPDGLHSWCNKCKYDAIKQARLADPDRDRELSRLRRLANPEKYRAVASKWRENNRDKCREHSVKYTRKARSTVQGRLNSNISTAIRGSLKGGKSGRRWEHLVGFTLCELMKELEKKFLPGMTWENRNKWHIDHIVPIAAFNFEKAEDIDFRRCWNLKNLRPIWSNLNQSKGAKLSVPFQPSLAISA